MRVLVTGVKGQLGHDVMDKLAAKGIEGIGVDVEEMDITDAAACEKVITEAKPDAVIHCAAYTAVDAAEDNVELCRKVNAEGTRNIAKVCKSLDIKMMYISTDYVFNGEGQRPWEPDDHREPLNVYGLTKYEGEIAVEQNLDKYFIVRIAWVFGKYGRYHATNEGLCSWYDFACEIFRQAGMDEVKVTPVDSSAFPVKAKRPSNSRLNKEKLTEKGFERLPAWQDALGRYLKELKGQEGL